MFDKDWLDNNLRNITDNLSPYVADTEYTLPSAFILDYITPYAIEYGLFTTLIVLFQMLRNTFEDDSLIPYPENTESLFSDKLPNYAPDKTSNKTRYPDEYFRIQLHLGHLSFLLHDAKSSKDYLSNVVELLPTTSEENKLDAYCVILKLKRLGLTVSDTLNYKNFVRHINQLAVEFPDKKLDAYIATSYYHYAEGNLGQLATVYAKITKLMGSTQQAVELINQTSAEQHLFLAVMHRERNNFDSAMTHLDAASERYANVNNPQMQVVILNETALLYALMERNSDKVDKNWKRVEQWLQKAYQELYKLPEDDRHSLQAQIDHTKGHALLYQHAYDEAIETFKNTLSFWEATDNQYHLALTHNSIGYTYIQLNQQYEALNHLFSAKITCEKLTTQHATRLQQLIDENLNLAQNLA
jgi:tetratricopeptide (TPR) repeat protein